MNPEYTFVRPIFIVLNLLTLFLAWQMGKKMSKTKSDKAYWFYGLFFIMSYAVSMGLRFGRMIDYNIYFSRYVEIGHDFTSHDYEFTFKAICWTLYNIGVPYQGFICLCSVLLVSSVVFMLKDYRKYAPYALLLFFWETANVENFIRWFLAFSLFIYFFAYYRRKAYKKAAIFALLAVTTHIGSVILIAAVVGISLFKKQMIPSWLVFVFLVLSLLYGSAGGLSFLTPYISLLGLDERSAGYAEQFGDIISGDFGVVGLSKLTFSNIIRIIIAYSIPVFMMSALLKNKMLRPFEVNLFIVGVLLAPIFGQVEILNRYGEGLRFFSVIVSGSAYYLIFKHVSKFPVAIVFAAYISFFANVWPVVSSAIGRTQWYEMLYIWDASSRDVLPLIYFRS